MAEPSAELLAAVRQQAEARVRMDIDGYAHYLTAEAVDSLRASFPDMPQRLNAYEVIGHQPRGVDFLVDVRYSARDRSFVVRSRWRELEEGWRVVRAERYRGERSRWSRALFRLWATLTRPVARLFR